MSLILNKRYAASTWKSQQLAVKPTEENFLALQLAYGPNPRYSEACKFIGVPLEPSRNSTQERLAFEWFNAFAQWRVDSGDYEDIL